MKYKRKNVTLDKLNCKRSIAKFLNSFFSVRVTIEKNGYALLDFKLQFCRVY